MFFQPNFGWGNLQKANAEYMRVQTDESRGSSLYQKLSFSPVQAPSSLVQGLLGTTNEMLCKKDACFCSVLLKYDIFFLVQLCGKCSQSMLVHLILKFQPISIFFLSFQRHKLKKNNLIIIKCWFKLMQFLSSHDLISIINLHQDICSA